MTALRLKITNEKSFDALSAIELGNMDAGLFFRLQA